MPHSTEPGTRTWKHAASSPVRAWALETGGVGVCASAGGEVKCVYGLERVASDREDSEEEELLADRDPGSSEGATEALDALEA